LILDKKIDSLIVMISVSGGRFPRGRRWASSVASRSAGSHLSHCSRWSRRLPLQSMKWVARKSINCLLLRHECF